jgi:hypothetical protein
MYSLQQQKSVNFNANEKKPEMPISSLLIKEWQILGPIGIGKLEIDADPTFLSTIIDIKTDFDVGKYILSLPNNFSVYSDLATGGKVKWKSFQTKPNNNEVCY